MEQRGAVQIRASLLFLRAAVSKIGVSTSTTVPTGNVRLVELVEEGRLLSASSLVLAGGEIGVVALAGVSGSQHVPLPLPPLPLAGLDFPLPPFGGPHCGFLAAPPEDPGFWE